MDRKQFIKTAGMACISSTVVASILQSCASSNYFAKFSVAHKKIILHQSEFIKIEKDNKQTIRKFVIVKTDLTSFPVCVFKISDKEYTALLMECTHNSCELNPQGGFLLCPCHGSEFSNKGVVQNPPAENNLKSYNVTIENENLIIQL